MVHDSAKVWRWTHSLQLNLLQILQCKCTWNHERAKNNSWQHFVSKLNTASKLKTHLHYKYKNNAKKDSHWHKIYVLKKCLLSGQQKVPKNQCAEIRKLNFTARNSEDYNKPFSLTELVDSINKFRNTSVGPGEIHKEFLKQLNMSRWLLNVFYNIWTSHSSQKAYDTTNNYCVMTNYNKHFLIKPTLGDWTLSFR